MFFMDLAFKGDRFDMSRYMESSGAGRDPLTSHFFMEIMKFEKDGELVLSPEMEHRPDLISYNIYRSTKFWWILLMYNSKESYKDFVSGERISYPKLSDIESYYFTAVRKVEKEECIARRVRGMLNGTN